MNVVAIAISVFAIASADLLHIRKCQNDQFECDDGGCISKRHWCQSYRHYCNDRSDQRNCNSYPKCADDQIACHAQIKCIPWKWACDNYVDCSDGSDEKDCYDGYKIEDSIKRSRQKATSWLLKQRMSNYGWEGRSHRAIAALYLSNTKQFYPGDYESKLMVKQLQLHLSQVILKGKPIPTHDTALYVHSLLSTCINPRKFQYRDFVKELKQSLENSDSFSAFFALVLCNANATLSPESISKLGEIMNQGEEPEWTEQQAYALMAVKCIQKRRENFVDALEDVADASFLYNVASNLKSLQRNNGSFGSLHTTALVMQALQAINDSGKGWDSKKAYLYLMSQQRSDGSFDNDVLATYLVLPVLNKKSLLDLGNVSCPSNDSSDITAKDELDSRNDELIKLTYTIIVGLRKDISFTITLSVPYNATLHDVMRLAEELDHKYRFKCIPYSWGCYVHSLFGIANDPEAGLYWQLFRMTKSRPTLVNEAPDKLILETRGERYIYWYRPTSRIVGNQVQQLWHSTPGKPQTYLPITTTEGYDLLTDYGVPLSP